MEQNQSDDLPIEIEMDFLARLDKEIAKVSLKAELERSLISDRKKLHSNKLSGEEKQAFRERYMRTALHLDSIRWRAEAAVALFVTQHCDSCGSSHQVFLQHMERQATIHRPRVVRFHRVPKPNLDLPKEVMQQITTTHMCSHCCEDYGFALVSAKTLLAGNDPITIPPSYTQEEIVTFEESEA